MFSCPCLKVRPTDRSSSRPLLLPYGEYFDIDFSLPKVDLVAINEFHGAMENWGLVFFQADMLLLEPSDQDYYNW